MLSARIVWNNVLSGGDTLKSFWTICFSDYVYGCRLGTTRSAREGIQRSHSRIVLCIETVPARVMTRTKRMERLMTVIAWHTSVSWERR